jgi:hypothetical protein
MYRISELSGVSRPQIARFMKGERDLYLGAVARLATALGLSLVKTGPGLLAEASDTSKPATATPKRPRGRSPKGAGERPD